MTLQYSLGKGPSNLDRVELLRVRLCMECLAIRVCAALLKEMRDCRSMHWCAYSTITTTQGWGKIPHHYMRVRLQKLDMSENRGRKFRLAPKEKSKWQLWVAPSPATAFLKGTVCLCFLPPARDTACSAKLAPPSRTRSANPSCPERTNNYTY